MSPRLNGKAAEVHVYDGTALTAVEVLELHGRMLGTYEGA